MLLGGVICDSMPTAWAGWDHIHTSNAENVDTHGTAPEDRLVVGLEYYDDAMKKCDC